MQKLLFFPDYGADPLWELPAECMMSLDSLPIGNRLRDSVRAWAAQWEKLAWQQMEADDLPTGQREAVTEQQWAESDRQGYVLWQELQRELGGSYSIGLAHFRHGLARQAQWTPHGPIEPCPPGDQ